MLIREFKEFADLNAFSQYNSFVDVSGKDLANLVQSTLSENIPPFEAKSNLMLFYCFPLLLSKFCRYNFELEMLYYMSPGGDLEDKYKSFLLSEFQEVPEELSF